MYKLRLNEVLLLAVCLLFCRSVSADVEGDAIQAIRVAIPHATALEKETAEQIGLAASGPKRSGISNKSLTLMLMTIKYTGEPKLREEFHVEAGAPHLLARELFRYKQEDDASVPATLIHADRITDLTCKRTGDVARGTLSFSVPDGYSGKVRYTAKKNGKWEIVRFDMPAHGIHISRQSGEAGWKECGKANTYADERSDERADWKWFDD